MEEKDKELMSKHKQHSQQPRRNLYVALGIGLALIVIVIFLTTRGTTSAAQNLSPTDYQTQFISGSTNHFLLDVRTADEFTSGHIHGAINIPLDELQSRISEVPTDQAIVVYCRSGNRSAQASQILAQAGYTRLYDMGGLNDWVAQGFPVE